MYYSYAKQATQKVMLQNASSCNPLYYVGNRFDSVNHSRFRCNNSTLNHDLFIRNCVVSLACPQCNAPVEDVKHYFLYCLMYTVHRITLFTSAGHLLGDKWLLALDKKKIESPVSVWFSRFAISVECSFIRASSVIYSPFISFF